MLPRLFNKPLEKQFFALLLLGTLLLLLCVQLSLVLFLTRGIDALLQFRLLHHLPPPLLDALLVLGRPFLFLLRTLGCSLLVRLLLHVDELIHQPHPKLLHHLPPNALLPPLLLLLRFLLLFL